MKSIKFLLADQLSESISSLQNTDKQKDTIMLCEVMSEATYAPHHPKKIAFLFSAMRHFAANLQQQGFRVRYVKLDDPCNSGSLEGEIRRAIDELKPDRIILTQAAEWRVLQMMNDLKSNLNIPVEIRIDDRFLCSIAEFKEWSLDKKTLRMEFFYRQMRVKHNFLMDNNGKPVGGKWNYDKENRKPPGAGMVFPKRISHKKSPITTEVLNLVKDKFSHHFGDLEPFHFAVTRQQALMELDDFIENLLINFGDHQDAMVADEPYLYHSLISSYLNCGLLLPLEICQKAQNAYLKGKAPLNAVEGFIRQILGWREYVRGIYWSQMPKYGELNFFDTKTPLPNFYWGANTNMFCVSQAVDHTKKHAYSHHIQRLMITGNFALLAGLDVKEVQEWYLSVYSDAYEWVEMPNTLGMALFGDGGIVASKPYAASGKYINRMSNYCKKCHYDPNEMLGENACPFNAMYWNFLSKNDSKLRGNYRIPYVFTTWDKFGSEKQQAILAQAESSLRKMKEENL
ncbi:MAG: deoxyribodipyrimidine photolyase-related protein [Rickettsiales bacterium]|jgi:deoxyribodipyrimidine photolyase-related protein